MNPYQLPVRTLKIHRKLSKEQQLSQSVCSDLCTTTVLLCDDEDFNLLPLQMMLKDVGIVSQAFETGTKAVNCFQKRLLQSCCSRTFRLVLSDICMPGLDGYEVCT